MFLPFDLDAFEFFSGDSNDPLSRVRQEAVFEAFNRMVLRSAIGRSSATQELIKAWYGADLLSERAKHRFIGLTPPPGWLGNPLYLKFIAVGCRSCHISWVDAESIQPGPLTFATAGQFFGFMKRAKDIVCSPSPPIPAKEAHKMPAAEQTVKVLWRSEGRQHLFAQNPDLQPGDCRP